MAETIVEVPLEPLAEEPVSEENTVVQEPPKRGRGRPPGSKNKQPKATLPAPAPPEPPPAPAPKPKAKASASKKRSALARAPRAQPVYVQYEEDSESSEEQRPPRKRAAAPELDRTALAAEVLGLLSQTHAAKATARQNNYRAWFQ